MEINMHNTILLLSKHKTPGNKLVGILLSVCQCVNSYTTYFKYRHKSTITQSCILCKYSLHYYECELTFVTYARAHICTNTLHIYVMKGFSKRFKGEFVNHINVFHSVQLFWITEENIWWRMKNITSKFLNLFYFSFAVE